VRLEYRKPEKKFQARVFASSIYGIGVTPSRGSLSLSKSLQTRTFIFEKDGDFTLYGDLAPRIGVVSSIGINKNIIG
jgi:hypothetical protein